jgi:hypothetical protein
MEPLPSEPVAREIFLQALGTHARRRDELEAINQSVRLSINRLASQQLRGAASNCFGDGKSSELGSIYVVSGRAVGLERSSQVQGGTPGRRLPAALGDSRAADSVWLEDAL